MDTYKSIYVPLGGTSNSTTPGVGEIDLLPFKNKYKYFKLTATSNEGQIDTCAYQAWSSQNSSAVTLILNTEYEIGSSTDGYNFTGLIVTAKSNSNNWSRCWGGFTFYN